MSGELKAIWEERAADPTFKERNEEYDNVKAVYRGYEKGENPPKWWTRGSLGKPLLYDDGAPNQREDRLIVNIASQVVNHWSSQLGKVPIVTALPMSSVDADLKLADRKSDLIWTSLNQSSMSVQQLRQAHRFSLDGDAVYSVEWSASKGRIYIRCWDPAWCYPTLDDIDMGAVHDMLIVHEVTKQYAADKYGVVFPESQPEPVKVFTFWTTNERKTAVEEHTVEAFYLKHDLGFVPFRWAFSRPTGEFGTSDVHDIVLLQDAYNEIIRLMFAALHKAVFPAYWGKGLKENVVPVAGEVVGLQGTNVEIHPFDLANPPDMLLNVLGQVAQDARAGAGMSPYSMEGTGPGSVNTGKSIQRQIEAVEARGEIKKLMMESTFRRLGEYVLEVAEKKFADSALLIRGRHGGVDKLSAGEVAGYYDCQAHYGDLYGLNLASRIQVALQGLGRVYDDHQAIALVDFENVKPAEMVKRIEDYQLRMAATTGKSQTVSQEAGQSQQGQQPGQSPIAPPQGEQKPTPPSPQQFMATLDNIEKAIKVVESGLHGHVWAIGELAIAAQAASPTLMVENDRDLAAVQGAVNMVHGSVTIGHPNGTPSILLA